MPEEPDLRQTLMEAQEATYRGDYAAARALFRRVRQEASPRSTMYEEATRYLRHLGESDEDPAFRLLRQIEQTADIEARLALVRRTLEVGLEKDLHWSSLTGLLQELEQERTERADQEAQDLLDEADKAKADIRRAIEICQQALEVAGISRRMQTSIHEQVTRLERREQAANLLARAHNALAQPTLTPEDYRTAWWLVQEAQPLAPDDRTTIAELLRKLEEDQARVQKLQEALEEARGSLAASPAEARATYEQAQQEAEALKLAALADEARKGFEEAEGILRERIAQAQDLLRQGDEAQARGDLAQARQLFQEARDLAGKETDAEQRLGQVNRRMEVLARIEALRDEADEASKKYDYGRAIARLKEAGGLAQEVAPEQAPALEDQVRQLVSKRAEAQEILTTIKLQLLPYATPQEYTEALDDQEKKFGAGLAWVTAKIFRGQATGKLRLYLEAGWQAVEAGSLEDACRTFEIADRQWDEYLKSQSVRLGDIPALRNRLQLLRAQLADVRAARDAYAPLTPLVAQAGEALNEERYQDALVAYGRFLDEFPALPANVRYVLGERLDRPGDGAVVGVLRKVREGFATAARRCAREQDRQLEEWQHRARSALRLGTPQSLEEARQVVDEQALPLAHALRTYKARHDEFVPQEQRAGWTTADRLEPLEALSGQIARALRLQYLLAAGEERLNAGDHAGAEDAFQEALEVGADSRLVQTWRQRVRKFKDLREKLEGAEAANDVEAQDRHSRAILELLPLSSWAASYRQKHDLDRRMRERAKIQRDLERADRWVQRGQFEKARPLVEALLLQMPDDAHVLRLVHAIEEGEAGQQQLAGWLRQARESFGRGEFSQAVELAGQVLEERPADREATLLRDKAARAHDLEERAAGCLSRGKYTEADGLLRQVMDIEGMDSVSSRHQRWLDEIDRQLAARRDRQELLRNMREAVRQGNWMQAAGFARQVLSQEGGHPEARRTAQESRRRLCAQVSAVVQSRQPEQLKPGLQMLQALERYFPQDAEVHQLREALERVSHLVRARAMLARPAPDEEQLDALVQQLAALCADWSDPEAGQAYRDARYSQLLRQAARLERAQDSPRAVQALADALEIHREPEVEADYRRLRLQAALAESERLLLKGDLEQARHALCDFEGTAPAQTQLVRIAHCQSTMQTVRLLQAQGDGAVPAAMEALNRLLHEILDFEPAREARRTIIDDLLARGRNAEAADVWEAKRLYELLERIAPVEAAASNLKPVRQRAEQERRSMLDRVRQAIERPDNLEVADCENLIADVRRLPEGERDATLRANLVALEEYRSLIEVLRGHMAAAEALLDEAYGDKNKYQRAEQELDRACADRRSIFSMREQLRKLRERATRQRALHNEVEHKTATYRGYLGQVYQGAPALDGDDPAQVRTAVDEAKRVVDQALQAGAEVLELDPQDRYGCRKWLNKNQPDPLAEERQQLQAARANVEAIGHALLDGLAAWRAAQERAAQAENAGKTLVCDEDYARAIRLWEETGQLCQSSLDKLRQAASTPPRTPRAGALAQDAASIQERVERRLAHGQEQRQHYGQQLEQLQDRYQEAQGAEHHAHSRAAWRTARDAYAEVLALNPTYQPAMIGRQRCQSEVNKPARPWWPYALAAALGIVLVGFLAWFFGVGPGSRAEIVPTPTQATIVTGPAIAPVLTPVTITSSPTPTTATPTPAPTRTPSPTIPPRTCTIYNQGNAWARSQPDTHATGELLASGTKLQVVDFVDSPDGKWYRIAAPIDGWWVRAVEVTCPE